MDTSAGPKATPPDTLRFNCLITAQKLKLIPEFSHWLELSLEIQSAALRTRNRPITPYDILWQCFCLGKPLCVLLDLLGTPSGRALESVTHHHGNETTEESETWVKSFIDRVQLLEAQGRLSYGEVFRVEDLCNGTFPGFAKVLRTVDRVLVALQATYPGLYCLSSGYSMVRTDHFEELIDSERAHVDLLRTMFQSATALSNFYGPEYGFDGMVIECLGIFLERLLLFHQHVLTSLDGIVSSPHLHEQWDEVFSLDNNPLRPAALGAQRSYCVQYLSVLQCLEKILPRAQPGAISHIEVLLDHLSEPLFRIMDHRRLIQSILDLTLPSDTSTFDTLCLALHRTSTLSEEIDEIGEQARTTKGITELRTRVSSWSQSLNHADDLGLLVLDDHLLADAASGLQHSVFLFETVLLCCHDTGSRGSRDDSAFRSFLPCYPIAKWEYGPAMNRSQPLDVLFTIPTALFHAVRRVSPGAFEIDWIDRDILHTHSFTALFVGQCDQWYSVLQKFTPQRQNPIFSKTLIHALEEHGDEGVMSEDEDFGGRRSAHPRPWSLIGRKQPSSESSSMIRQEHYDYGLPVSPGMLPNLFYGLGGTILRSPSPSHLSVKSAFSHRFQEDDTGDQFPPTPPPEAISGINTITNGSLLDLTGKIKREGKYPCAHGGFADVWKGIWRHESKEYKVAIKVLRSRTDDPEVETKMQRRLRRELRVWQRLDYAHVLPLYGTASDYGHYTAFVCPWLEHGSVSKYLEMRGDVLTMLDRLQVLSETAQGLAYLHSFDVVHGDLTGSNILIDDEGKARLCDFGLSSIAADFQSTSHLTSTIGGNVRWAAPELYHIYEDDSTPSVTTYSDIYSFGSVMLEVLSGHVPYSYLLRDAQVVIEVHKGVKPRRPSTPFVTNQLWAFINVCWNDEPTSRPDIVEVSKSMQEFLHGNRRHTS